MTRLLLLAFAAATLLHAEDGFVPLFNGKNLDGWTGDTRLWSVQNGEIVGKTDGITLTDNSFLRYDRAQFSNFVLHAKMKLRNHNSGVQFRSVPVGEYAMRGFQADAAENNWWGSLYDEKGPSGVIVNGWKGKGETVLKANDWNEYEILADGDHIRLTLNGLVTVDTHNSEYSTGYIGLQLHRGPGMEVHFKDIEIKVLPATRSKSGD